MSRVDVEQVLHLLELLDREAPVEQLAQVRAGAATAIAVRIRQRLSRYHRRAAGLSALFDTASDLAGLQGTDAVLQSIVRRARMLLRTDLAYLTFNDPAAGLTSMRVTAGSTSALFQQVVLGMGEGLGGLVAQTARPYATADYAADTRFDHTTPIDEAVTDEGLVAILGVPLRLGQQVLGVLYAGDRAEREFSTEEVSLLSSLADHAAIALESARLLEDSRTAGETIRAHNEALRRAEAAHDRLTDLVLRGGDSDQIAAALASVLDGGIIVHDTGGVELARCGTSTRQQDSGLVAESARSGRAVTGAGLWVCAVLAGPELLGSITLSGREVLSDADRRLFERASVVTALLLLLQRSVAEAEDRVRGELITDLLTAPDRDQAGLLARGRRLGVDLRERHCVAVAEAADPRRLRSAAARALPVHSLLGVQGDLVVMVVGEDQPGTLAQRLAKELGDALDQPVTVGAAGPVTGPPALARAHTEAVKCLRAMVSLGQRGRGSDSAGLGFLGVLLGDPGDLSGYVRSTLGPVLDYDARRGTELVRTLRGYFACGGNLNRTKDELHVHVNTVVQRLDRVAALLGASWQEPERALEIQLALRLHEIVATTRPGPCTS
ncbi:helix-turn-helix domain-containing protein [Kutzneria albida]|uniref:GAF domain-containing protein n=1 Tax=Kutzneria albida DSM 43870 TaxID=1449976 RepID=W5W826_9PSEU|nr:helix-turn-helix domain-containing protein [Kutzneria albida]AHH96666.1 GAF domain-containing protein [Kutzneria albida DSM 43870]